MKLSSFDICVNEFVFELNEQTYDIQNILSYLASKLLVHPSTIKLCYFNANKIKVLVTSNKDLVAFITGEFDTLYYYFIEKSNEEGHGEIFKSLPVLFESKENQTVYSLFESSCEIYGSKEFLGYRDFCHDKNGHFVWLSYNEIRKLVQNVSLNLQNLGFKKYDYVGFALPNSVDWIIVDLSTASQGIVNIPLSPSIQWDILCFVIKNSAMKAIFVEPQLALKLCDNIQMFSSLKHIFVVTNDATFTNTYIYNNLQIVSMFEPMKNSIQDKSKQNESIIFNVHANDIYTIVYTSGTTGNPKGVILTHKNFISRVYAGMNRRRRFQNEQPIALSSLPLFHVMERSHYIREFIAGYKIGFSQGDSAKILDDIKTLQPTQIVTVPLIWKRLYERLQPLIHQNINNLNQLSQSLGLNRLCRAGCGSASLPSHIKEFFVKHFQLEFYEGYGLTECSGTAVTSVGQDEPSIVGFPVSSCMIKLVSVPELSYLVNDTPCPRGEIWVKGTQAFNAYVNYSGDISEILSDDGWVKTGDIGTWTENHNLKIIDRKKSLFKLSNGEYIRPDVLENICKQSNLILNLVVTGDDTLRYPLAIVYPNYSCFDNMQNDEINPLILNQLQRLLTKNNCKRFEIINKVIISNEDFLVENGMLTSSMKLKRYEIYQRFKHLF